MLDAIARTAVKEDVMLRSLAEIDCLWCIFLSLLNNRLPLNLYPMVLEKRTLVYPDVFLT